MKTKISIDHDYAEQELFLARHGLHQWETHLLAFCTNIKITDENDTTVGYVWFHDVQDTGSPVCMVHMCIVDKRAFSRRLVRFIYNAVLDEDYQIAIGEISQPKTKKLWKAIGADVSSDALAFLDLKDMRIT